MLATSSPAQPPTRLRYCPVHDVASPGQAHFVEDIFVFGIRSWNHELSHKMAYGYRARRNYPRRGRVGYRRRNVFRAPFRRVRRNYVPPSAFRRPPSQYKTTRTGRFLKNKCAGLVRKTRPYIEKANPQDPLTVLRVPKAGWVAVTIVPAVAPGTTRVRFFRQGAIRQMARFVRGGAAASEPVFTVREGVQVAPIRQAVAAAVTVAATL